jgi:hypothetical protein
MSDIRPPSWIELRSLIPLETTKRDAVSVRKITTASPETIKREYPDLVVKISDKREGMTLANALRIAGTVIDSDTTTAA